MIADVNGDGIPDAVLVGSGTASVFLGYGDGTFTAPFSLGIGPSPGTVLPAYLHGQNPALGLADIVAPDESGGVMVLLNTTK